MAYLWADGGGFYFDQPNVTDTDAVWWRAEDRRFADYDPWAEFEQPNSSHLRIVLTPYKVVRSTPKGVWLDNGRFVCGVTTKQFAVPTPALALADLAARKQRHVAGCEARLCRAKQHLGAAKRALKELQP